ncbi:MAG: hypothetical protein HDS82_06845 [Bacteroidales bacterium]|nr:hypothetical protein [Bacteroidales bacterium]
MRRKKKNTEFAEDIINESTGKATDSKSRYATALKKTNKQIIDDVRFGRSVSLEFFRNNAWLLMVIVVALLSLIGLRYKTKTKMAQIQSLTTELQRAESSKLQEKAAYMSLIRETEMRRLVAEKGLGLDFQEQPPYELLIEN